LKFTPVSIKPKITPSLPQKNPTYPKCVKYVSQFKHVQFGFFAKEIECKVLGVAKNICAGANPIKEI
jgi:hypothetical protein